MTSGPGDRMVGSAYSQGELTTAQTGCDANNSWSRAPGGASSRTVTINDTLINNASYTFPVRSFSSTIGASEATTATMYNRHSRPHPVIPANAGILNRQCNQTP